jgi:hypothetical protein
MFALGFIAVQLRSGSWMSSLLRLLWTRESSSFNPTWLKRHLENLFA